MRLRPTLLVLGLLASASPAHAQAAPSVFVAYPAPDARVAFDHVILEGSVSPGASLSVNGQAVEVGTDGLFMAWWPLRPGTNDLKLVARRAGQTGTRTVRVIRTVPRLLPAIPTAIDRASLKPGGQLDFWDTAGDTPEERTVRLRFQGSPGGRAAVRLGSGPATPLREGPAGTYSGALAVPAQTALSRAPLTVSLTGRDGRTVSAVAGQVSSAAGQTQLGVQRPGTVPGLGLNPAPTALATFSGEPLLYPREGMTFEVVGRLGEDYRVRLAPGLSALVTATQLDIVPGLLAPPSGGALSLDPVAQRSMEQPGPEVVASPPATGVAGAAPLPQAPRLSGQNPAEGQLRLRVPLGGARSPFTVQQTAPGQLLLTLYGPLSQPLTAPAGPDPLLERVEIRPGNGVTQLSVQLRTTQLWGFSANYDGDDLVLMVRRPPVLDPVRPLLGRTITLDPGHGGTQLGGAGSLRTPEKGLVLPIAQRVAELLRAQGATVQLTRTADVTLGLYERGLMAEATGSDLLVSLHANALPDGRDPRGVRGPEVYFSHPQAQPLAAAILAALRTGLPDLGPGAGLKGGADLALTRPTSQISLLVELAYLTDAGNLRTLHSPAGQERFAQAVARGITAFYGSLSGR
ncbi:N-acetylmuramoyl-L-alanine amidase [Deinococcus navajonensis]|uniref:N-acetylmuramoyl-L-alanine amidase n=1 Tax=Deinococcus navajonensis TaxID=309884 RepID=A0ABV8XUP7_9DEIO